MLTNMLLLGIVSLLDVDGSRCEAHVIPYSGDTVVHCINAETGEGYRAARINGRTGRARLYDVRTGAWRETTRQGLIHVGEAQTGMDETPPARGEGLTTQEACDEAGGVWTPGYVCEQE